MRWPRKPPSDALCDASTGWKSDFLGAPKIIRCGKPATVTGLMLNMNIEMWLCGECAPRLAAKKRVRLNPKVALGDNPGGE